MLAIILLVMLCFSYQPMDGLTMYISFFFCSYTALFGQFYLRAQFYIHSYMVVIIWWSHIIINSIHELSYFYRLSTE